MPQINVDFLCFQGCFFAMNAFPFHSSSFCLYFSELWDQMLQLPWPVTDCCVQEMCLAVLWMLFQSPNPIAQWGSHCPRAGWTSGSSGAVVGFGCFKLQPKSSMWETVSLYWKPALAVKERGKSRWGAAPAVTLNLLPPPDFHRQCVLSLPHNLSLPGEGLISQHLNLCHFQQPSPLICSLASSRVAEPVPLLPGLWWQHP